MALLIVLVLIATPIIEIAVFIKVGGWVGAWPTLILVLATAVVGTWLLREQGLSVLWRMRRDMAAGARPVEGALEGVLLLLAGALLLVPGFVTDAVGLVLFLPPVRRALARMMLAHADFQGEVHVWRQEASRPGERGDENALRPPPAGKGPVIEGEYTDVSEKGNGARP